MAYVRSCTKERVASSRVLEEILGTPPPPPPSDAAIAPVSVADLKPVLDLDLAIALSAKDERDAAADHLLEIIRRDRKWNDEAARKQLLQLFEAWGLMDPASVAARRKLSAVWF